VIRHDKSFINSVSIEKLKKSPRGVKRRAVIIYLADEKQQTVPTTQDFPHRTNASVKPPWGRKPRRCPGGGVMDGPPEAGTRWEGATRSACALASSLDVASAKRSYVASADYAVKMALCAISADLVPKSVRVSGSPRMFV
jgi:hypothetical protein